MTTLNQISEWFDRAKEEENATHMLIVCDTFDYEDYPVVVHKGTDIKKKVLEYNNRKNMTKVMEVYDLSQDKEEQLGQFRSLNY